MLNSITLDRFKAFRHAELSLSNLNVLAGVNGTGKSTIIQALLLLRQSYLQGTLGGEGLLLRGGLLNLGNGQDIYHQFSTEETIGVKLSSDDEATAWEFDAAMKSDLLPFADDTPVNVGSSFSRPPFTNDFWYLAAERIVPDTSYAAAYQAGDQAGALGQHGQFTVDYLAMNQTTPLPLPSLRHRSLPETATDLLSNVRSYLSQISPGASLTPERFPTLDRAALTYDFISGKRSFSHKLRPTNVGFGLTYVLPVLVTLLAAKSGDLVLMENPESHVHPEGQMQLGLLAALAAAGGVQLIVETHSDHFVNGVRLAAKRKNIDPKKISIFYFHRDVSDPQHAAKITQPILDEDGKLSAWPEGFFDQWEHALFELL